MPFTGAENTVYQYTKAIAELAYIYGYAVISLWILMSVDVNTKAPFNQMYYYDSLPTPTNSPYRGPNADTLYATAWIDLSNTPISLATPDTRQQNRWYTVQLLDIFGNTFANLPGSEKNRPAQNYFLVGPSWTTDEYVVPSNSFLINAPSNIVYLVARVSVKDNDVTSAANVLNQITLQTVISNAPVLQVTQVSNSLYSTVDFFTLLMQVLNYNQQSIDDVVDSLFLSIGLNPDTYFSPTSLPAYTLQGYTDAVDVAFNQIIPNGYKYASGLVYTSSWQGGTKNGLYGNDFVRRAYSYYSGPAANVPDEQYYMTTNQDSTFALLNGTLHNYKMHFPAFSYPAVNSKWGFWSLTVYTPTLELYSNSINRYAFGTNNHNLVYNSDGSLDIFIQNTQPTGTDPNLANWIPCPSGPFRLILRMYSPTQTQILSPTNVPPVLVN